MKYDFTTEYNRHGMDALAVDGLGLIPGKSPERPKKGFDVIPMWVADMNFATVPTVIQAMQKRLEHPLFGYFMPSKEYYDRIMQWHSRHHQVEGLTRKNIGYENGVLGGVVSTITSFAAPGDAVLVHSPTYVGFTRSLKENGFEAVHSPLVKDEQGVFRMDYADMEKKIKAHHIHVAIFCSPHNPTGRVWQREEIEKAMEIYRKYDVIVVSDEIWSDIILSGHKHIPTQTISEDAKQRTVAMYAPSKTFNLAGLVGSYHIIYNETLRDKVESKGNKPHYNAMNVLSMHALIGAYQEEGYVWVDELRQVIEKNVDYACDFIHREFEGVAVTKPEGTYMLFIDCTEFLEKHGLTLEQLEKRGWDVGVGWQDGKMFFGEGCIRINLALPHARVIEAFRRLQKYVFVDTVPELTE